MILEGIVTTQDSAGVVNVAPMGPIVDETMAMLRLRPFQTSQTFRNLKAVPSGVFHVVDDVLLLAQAAIGRLPAVPPTFPAEKITGVVLAESCRWYEFLVDTLDDSQERAEIMARVVHTGRIRDFFGFNRWSGWGAQPSNPPGRARAPGSPYYGQRQDNRYYYQRQPW